MCSDIIVKKYGTYSINTYTVARFEEIFRTITDETKNEIITKAKRPILDKIERDLGYAVEYRVCD
jgi:hypothetical protein